MPELPEIITIRNDLRKNVLNRTIVDVINYDSYPLKPSKDYFEKYVVGSKIEAVQNIAKLLVIKLSSGYYLTAHLRMTGNIFLDHKDDYIKISLRLDDNRQIHFSCVRKFGYLEVSDQKTINDYKKKFGKSMLESNLKANEFVNLISKKKSPIKSLLLNQEIVSGIGNIYANDALFLSKIHPGTPANLIEKKKLETLFLNLRIVMQEGILHRGSSIDRFRDIFGNPGTHQEYFLIYGKKGKLCTQCEQIPVVYVKMHGRGTYFCPNCQPEI